MLHKAAVLLITALISISLTGCKKYNSTGQPPTQETNTSTQSTSADSFDQPLAAAFAIFTNGTFRVFTASMYHNQSSNVYIESSNPNLIQVKKGGVTWGDFFNTLPFKLSDTCLTTGTGETFCTNDTRSLKFYINREFTEDALSREIKNGDKLLVSYGVEKPEDTQIQTHQNLLT